MTRPALPAASRREAISITLAPAVISLVDEMIANGDATTRSRAIEMAIVFWTGAPATAVKRQRRSKR